MHNIEQVSNGSVEDKFWYFSDRCDCGWRGEVLRQSQSEALAAQAAGRRQHLANAALAPGGAAARGSTGSSGKLAGAGLVVLLLAMVGMCTGAIDASPSCGDVSHYSDEAYDAGQQTFDEDSMNDYVSAQRDLAAAEADCAEEGETPEY
ncbi:hypothetical protein [Nocardioides sp. SYSU DS0663]|uniref:hypothetical protein n=1 Tax=Nocardioides sp. SYSU DS0663 TaxID=3416445 RepID=UPI003F4C3056